MLRFRMSWPTRHYEYAVVEDLAEVRVDAIKDDATAAFMIALRSSIPAKPRSRD